MFGVPTTKWLTTNDYGSDMAEALMIAGISVENFPSQLKIN